MRGKTGAARIALATGCPVIPMAQWGAQRSWRRTARGRTFPAADGARSRSGHPVDLSDLMGQEQTGEVLQEATDRLMDAITALRRGAPRRGSRPPTGSTRAAPGCPETGNGRRPLRRRPTGESS